LAVWLLVRGFTPGAALVQGIDREPGRSPGPAATVGS
jgi:hypothetical protein